MEVQDKDARLAALAAQIAAVETRPGPSSAGSGAHLAHGGGGSAHGSTAVGEAGPGQRSEVVDRGSDDGRTDAELTVSAKAICLRLLAIGPRPRAGLAQALRRKGIPDHLAEGVLDRLTDVGLIDDVAYAQGYVRTKHRDRALGRSALRGELRKLGVDEEVMAVAVEAVDTTAERSRAAELIAKRVDAAMAAGPVAARRRLLGLLSRRGYGPEIAVPVVDRALSGYLDDVDDWS